MEIYSNNKQKHCTLVIIAFIFALVLITSSGIVDNASALFKKPTGSANELNEFSSLKDQVKAKDNKCPVGTSYVIC
jgi:hypothetical protein